MSDQPNTAPKGASRGRSYAFDLLDDCVDHTPAPRISLDDLIKSLGKQAFGACILLLSILSLLISHVPGISTLIGIPIMLFSVQMMLGHDKPWLPRWLGNRTFDKSVLRGALAKARGYHAPVEHWVRPRLAQLSAPSFEPALGTICLISAIVLALPVIFGNAISSLALALIAFGQLERDGLFIVAGTVLSALSALYAYLFYAGLYVVILKLIS
jgi:hypothetical protein